jgi:uncharacterized protein YkwD
MSGLLLRFARAVGVITAAAGLCSFATTVTPLTQPASAGTYVTLSSFDSTLLADINRARAAYGIRKLIAVAGTTDVAHGWSCRLASLRYLEHNPNLGSQLESHGSYNWTAYGENIGMESSSAGAGALFRAYMASPPHRANILDPDYKYIGVYTKRTSAFRWNTLDFVGRTSSSYNYGYGATRKTC